MTTYLSTSKVLKKASEAFWLLIQLRGTSSRQHLCFNKVSVLQALAKVRQSLQQNPCLEEIHFARL